MRKRKTKIKQSTQRKILHLLASSSSLVTRPEYIPENCEEHESDVDDDGDPESDLVAEVLLEVDQHQEAHAEAGDGSGHVSDERDLVDHFGRQTSVD